MTAKVAKKRRASVKESVAKTKVLETKKSTKPRFVICGMREPTEAEKDGVKQLARAILPNWRWRKCEDATSFEHGEISLSFSGWHKPKTTTVWFRSREKGPQATEMLFEFQIPFEVSSVELFFEKLWAGRTKLMDEGRYEMAEAVKSLIEEFYRLRRLDTLSEAKLRADPNANNAAKPYVDLPSSSASPPLLPSLEERQVEDPPWWDCRDPSFRPFTAEEAREALLLVMASRQLSKLRNEEHRS